MEAIAIVDDNKNAAGEEAKSDVHDEHTAVNGGDESETTVATTDLELYQRKDNQIHVSSNKKPLLFYLNLAKKYMNLYDGVELCALGMAITTVIIISENLKRSGLAIEKNVTISTVNSKKDKKGRVFRKAKIGILLVKAGAMDQNTDATTSNTDADNNA
ncbi:nucleic acid binding protein [Senna tora]|uniref:Nucleic acid binding protein n=1 Tax=Senna tora TaxID=362788 RepID=A0A835CCG1_9FABA|nr:nucleic acid binding protein [Senna tora]